MHAVWYEVICFFKDETAAEKAVEGLDHVRGRWLIFGIQEEGGGSAEAIPPIQIHP